MPHWESEQVHGNPSRERDRCASGGDYGICPAGTIVGKDEWPNAQPRHNQRLAKSISSSYELERMHNLRRIKCKYGVTRDHGGKIYKV